MNSKDISTMPSRVYLLRATLKSNTLKSKENYQLVTTLTYNNIIRRRDVLLGYYPLVPSCTGYTLTSIPL